MKLRYFLNRALGTALVAGSFLLAGPVLAADEATVQGDAQAGSQKVSMCIGCHGLQSYKVAFPELYHVPMIAGQNAEYIVAALKEYANGSRTFETMEAIAQSLSEQDMADVAAYYAALK